MKVLLEGLLPRLFPNLVFLCIPHEGKPDLKKSIPRKLSAWCEPGVRFVVLMDNDGGDCRETKENLASLCQSEGRLDVLVRIACQELEAWYLGDPVALAEAFGNAKLSLIGRKALYRDPDSVQGAAEEVRKLVPMFQKVSGARRMAPLLSRETNNSRSFQVLINGLDRVAAAM